MRPARFATAVGGALLVGGVMIPLATPAAATELPVEPVGWPAVQADGELPPGSSDWSDLPGWSPAQSYPGTVSVLPAPGAGTVPGPDDPSGAIEPAGVSDPSMVTDPAGYGSDPATSYLYGLPDPGAPSGAEVPSDYSSDPATSYLYEPPVSGAPSDTEYPPDAPSDGVTAGGDGTYVSDYADAAPSIYDGYAAGTPPEAADPTDPAASFDLGDYLPGSDPSTDPSTDLWKLLSWLMSLSS